MDRKHALECKLSQAWPPGAWSDLTVVVAVSGGADSVALLQALAALRESGPGRLVVAHFNHGWRGEESMRDEQFVADLAGKLGLQVEVGRPDATPLAEADVDRTEDTARRQRYQFLQSAAERLGARYVTTAHTADDQAETILQRVLRGTGLSGLGGMRRARPLGPAVTLIRPLLDFRRQEMVEYLDAIGQSHRVDASNADQKYTRNRIRHELLPLLAERYYPGATESLLRLGVLAGEAQEVIHQRTIELAERSVRIEPDQLYVDCMALAQEPRYLIRELLSFAWKTQGWPLVAMGYAEWDSLAAFVGRGNERTQPPSRMFPGEIHAQREGQILILSRRR